MPAVSKKQQKFFGIVRAIQKGEMAPTTPETAKAAADMKKGDVKKFASTKHKGLPEKKKIEEDRQINKIIKQLRKSVKSHKKQADTLEKKVKTFKESNFSNITVGNKVGQTFQHTSGATITLDGALGGKMMVPSQVTIEIPGEFGEGGFPVTVDGPSESDFGLAGFTKPLDIKLQKRIADQSVAQINDRLDASRGLSGAETARVSGIPSRQDGFGGGQGNRTNRRGSAFNKDGSVNLGAKGDMTYKDVTDALNAIADKYNKKRDPLYAAIRERRAGTEAADKIDAYNRASEKEEKAVYDAWDEFNKQQNPDLNLPQDIPDSPENPDLPDAKSDADAKAGYEKAREGNPDLPSWDELSSDLKLPDIPKEGWTYLEYMAMYNALGDAAARMGEPIEQEIMRYSPTGFEGSYKTYIDQYGQENTPIGLIDAREAITNALTRAQNALTAKWEAYNKMPDLPSGPDGDEEEKPTGLARVLGGAIDQITGNRTDFDKRGGEKFNPVAATADALTGNFTDFDNRGGIPTGANRFVGGVVDQITGNRTDFDRRGGEKFNPIDRTITKIYGAVDGAKLITKINPAIQRHKRDFAKANNISPLGIPQEFKNKGYENSVIKDGNPGSFTNPVINPISDRTKKKFIKALDLNNNSIDIATQIINLSGDSFHKATGMKTTHSEIPGKAGDAEYNVVLNDKGGIEIFDNYAFTPRGYMDYPGTGIAKKIGGTELQKDVATMYDKAGPVGALAHTLLGDIPDRQDPPVRFKTVFTKKDLIRYLGDTNYKILINRMKNERKNRDELNKRAGHKINASNLGLKESKLSFKLIQQFREESNPRIPRKTGQPANSKKHSDLYTDENPKGTIHGLGFKDVATSKASVSKIRNSSRSHAHKIQAAVAMEQRAREMGKTSEAAVYRKYINSMKKKTKKMNEAANPAQQAAIAISMKKKGIKPKNLKEQIQFAQMQQRIRDAKEKRREQQKKSEKLYIDTKKKGVKFYDKKGSGRLKDGKKIYD